MKLTEQQKKVAVDWWVGQITRTGTRPLNQRQLNSFGTYIYSMLGHYDENEPGLRGALQFIDRPSNILGQALGYPAMQVDGDGGRAEAISWDNCPRDTIMIFTDDGKVLVIQGLDGATELTPAQEANPE